MLFYTLLLLILSRVSARCGWDGQVYVWNSQDDCDIMQSYFENRQSQSFVDKFGEKEFVSDVKPRSLNPGFVLQTTLDWFDQLNIGIDEREFACTGVIYSSSVGYATSLENIKHYSLYIDFHFLTTKDGHAVVVNGEAQQVCDQCNLAFSIKLPLVGKSVVSLYLMNFYPGVRMPLNRFVDASGGFGPKVFVDPYVRDNENTAFDRSVDIHELNNNIQLKAISDFNLDFWNNGLLIDKPAIDSRNFNYAASYLGNMVSYDHQLSDFFDDHTHDGVYGGFLRFFDFDVLTYDGARSPVGNFSQVQDLVSSSAIFDLAPSQVFSDNDWNRLLNTERMQPLSLEAGTTHDFSHFGHYTGANFIYSYDSSDYEAAQVRHSDTRDNWSDLEMQWCRLERWTTLFVPCARDWLMLDLHGFPDINVESDTVTVGISTGLGQLGWINVLESSSCVSGEIDPEEGGQQYAIAIGNPCYNHVYQSATFLPVDSHRAYPLCYNDQANEIKAPLLLDLVRLGTELGCPGQMTMRDAEIACGNLGEGWRQMKLVDQYKDGVNCNSRCLSPFGLFWTLSDSPFISDGSFETRLETGSRITSSLIKFVSAETNSTMSLPVTPVMDNVKFDMTFELDMSHGNCDVFSLAVAFNPLDNGDSVGDGVINTVTKWRISGSKGFDVFVFSVHNTNFDLPSILSKSVFSDPSLPIVQGRVLFKQLNFDAPPGNFPTYGVGFYRDMLPASHSPVVSFIGRIMLYKGQCEFVTFSPTEALVSGAYINANAGGMSFFGRTEAVGNQPCPIGYYCFTSGPLSYLPVFEFLYSSKVDDRDHFSLHWTCGENTAPFGDDVGTLDIRSLFDIGTSRAFHVREKAQFDPNHGIDPDDSNLVYFYPVVSALALRPIPRGNGMVLLHAKFPGNIILATPLGGSLSCSVSQGPIKLLLNGEIAPNGLAVVGVSLTLNSAGNYLSIVTCNYYQEGRAPSSVVVTRSVIHPGYARILVGYNGVVQKWVPNNSISPAPISLYKIVPYQVECDSLFSNAYIFRFKHSAKDFTLPSTAVEVRVGMYRVGSQVLRTAVVGVQVNWGNDVVGVWEPRNVNGSGFSAYVSTRANSDSGLEMIATPRGWEISAPDGFNVIISRSFDGKFIDVKIDVSISILNAACDGSQGHYCFGDSLPTCEFPPQFGDSLFGYPSATNTVHQPYDSDFLPTWGDHHSHVPARSSFPNAPPQPSDSLIWSVQQLPGDELHSEAEPKLADLCSISQYLASLITRYVGMCSQPAYQEEQFCILQSIFHTQLVAHVCVDYFETKYMSFGLEHPFGHHESGYHQTVIYYFYEYMFQSGVVEDDFHRMLFKGVEDAVTAHVLFCGDHAQLTGLECICDNYRDDCMDQSVTEVTLTVPSGLERSVVINSVTGEAWRMYKRLLYYFTVTSNWVALPASEELWPVVLDLFTCDNEACTGGTVLCGRTVTGLSIISTDKGISWNSATSSSVTDKAQSFDAHHNFNSTISFITGLGSDVWWLTEKHLCVLSNRLASQSKPLEYCVTWWCDCAPSDL